MASKKEHSLAQRLQKIGVKKSHAYMLAWGKRSPSLQLALHIHHELGVKLGPLATATEGEVKALKAMTSRDAAA